MDENVVVVKNWNDLQERLFENSWNEDLQRYRAKSAYRGLSDATYPLHTSLMRMGGRYAELEHHLLRNFRKYAHRNVVERDSLWHWLSVAQHHGLPTRLMDWTYSPLVAAHFATSNIEKYGVDGAIWVLDYQKAHKLNPPAIRAELEREGANVYTVQMLNHAVDSLQAMSSLSAEDYLVFFEPASIDDRIVNQYAFFSVFSDPRKALDEWLASHRDLWRKIVIPAHLKWEVRDKLDQANLSERVFFPGLDGLSRWLTRQYSPKEKRHSP